MNKVAIAFLTKDRVELSRQTIVPLLQPDKFDLFWIDGSTTLEGQELPEDYSQGMFVRQGIKGGPDAAVVYALTQMLESCDFYSTAGNISLTPRYTHIGLVENDVLLAPDWFDRTMELFKKGARDDIPVGAVSARCYVDRILIQQDDYAVVMNLGWGQQIMTREAAHLALKYMRTSSAADNRKVFSQLSGIDIGAYWAFKGLDHFLCADWSNDRILAAHGLASLALTPSPVEMIGQVPPLAEQGLILADRPIEEFRNDAAFERYSARLNLIRSDDWQIPVGRYHHDTAGYIIFPHQMQEIGGVYEGEWKLKWSQGLGPFAWQSDAADEAFSTLIVPVFGACEFLVSGHKGGGQASIYDKHSGYMCSPMLQTESTGILALAVPGTYAYRELVLSLARGCIFYGLRTREPQPWSPNTTFDHSMLPPV